MTAERLPRFTPSSVDRRYRVTLMENKWDSDEGKFTDTVTAIGPVGARKTAEDKWRHEYPDVCAVHVEEIVLDPDFHDGEGGCGFAWSAHRPVTGPVPDRPLPFGCPSELKVRAAWGDR